MAYQVLARKYRPTRFSDVVGQDHVTRTLLNALAQNASLTDTSSAGTAGIGKIDHRAHSGFWRSNCSRR